MDDVRRKLLRGNLVALTRDLDPRDIYDELIAGGVLTLDEKERIRTICPRRDEASELISVLLRKGPNAFGVLVNALESTYPHLYALLSRSTCTADTIIESVRSELQNYYKDRLRSIYPMPWLQEIRLRLRDVYVKRQLQLTTTRNREETKVDIDQLFALQDDQEIPKRLLIEGDPGLGKTTLCHTLAYEWSQQSCGDQCGSPCIHSFDLVIYLHAGDFQAQNSIADAIRSHLLPSDSPVSSNSLKDALQTCAAVLFIIDAYDEASADNVLLEDVIKKKLLRQSTLLLTSRRNFLRDKLKYFDSRYSVEGYDKDQQLEHVRRFAEHQKIPITQFESLLEKNEVKDLCNSPLNLTLLCLLYTEESYSFSSRTALYCSIHNCILRKASRRINLTPEEIERQLLRPLYKLAFEAYQKNERVLHASDLQNVSGGIEQIAEVGYLTKEVIISRLQEELRYSFTHKTFLEFLAAKHLILLDPEESHAWVRNLFTLPFYPTTPNVESAVVPWKKFDDEQDVTVLAFLFGLLEGEPESLMQIATIVMQLTCIYQPNASAIYTSTMCPRSHVIFQVICELDNIRPELENAIIKLCPPRIRLGESCSASCLRGMLTICSLTHLEPRSITLNVRYVSNNHMSLVKELLKCKSINWIEIAPKNSKQLQFCLAALRVGQVDSIQYVRIADYRTPDTELHPSELPFGDDLRGIELSGYNPLNIRQCIEAVSKISLTTLTLRKCSVDESCMKLLSQLIRNSHLQHVALLTTTQFTVHMGYFLRHLESLNDLQSLEICLLGINQQEMNSLEIILKKNTLKKLNFACPGVVTDLCTLLSNNFSRMTSLQEFEITEEPKLSIDPPMYPILSNMHHLQLRKLCLRCFLRDDNLDAIIDAIPAWSNLQELQIADHSRYHVLKWLEDPHCIPYVLTEAPATRLIEAITVCRRLKIIKLIGMQIQDSVIPDLCKMLDSLNQLETFHLVYKYNDTLTDDGFKPLMTYFEQNRGFSFRGEKLPAD